MSFVCIHDKCTRDGCGRCCYCGTDLKRLPWRPHIVDGEFQSDKYPSTPRGKVPLSVKDATAQDLLWQYAQRRREVDAQFSDDLEFALRNAGYEPQEPPPQGSHLAGSRGPGGDSCDSTAFAAIAAWANDDSVCHSPRARDVMRFLLGTIDDMVRDRDGLRAIGRKLAADWDELHAKLTIAEADNAELHLRLRAAQQRLLELDPRASTPPPAGDGEA